MGKAASREIQAENFRSTQRGGVVLVNDNEDSRRIVEQCYKRHKTTVNPIIDWTDDDVWEFIRSNNIPYCCLYDEGFKRLGCIGCPLVGTKVREREFARWPKYKDAYFRAFQKLLDNRERTGDQFRMQQSYTKVTPLDVFNWWMEYDVLPGQITFDEMDELEDDEP